MSNALVINMHKGQRMDITAQMKDADRVLTLFRAHDIRFDKKYTTITEGPSTITFKGVRATKAQASLADLLCDLTVLARNDEMGNVYAKFVGMRPKMTSTIRETGNSRVETVVHSNMDEDLFTTPAMPNEDPNATKTTEEDDTL